MLAPNVAYQNAFGDATTRNITLTGLAGKGSGGKIASGSVILIGNFSTVDDDGSQGTFTVTIASPAVFTHTAHGLSVGDNVWLTTTGALPTGLAQNTKYWVSAVVDANTFRLSATSGGADINTSGSQSGTHTIHYMKPGVPNWGGIVSMSVTGVSSFSRVFASSRATEIDGLNAFGTLEIFLATTTADITSSTVLTVNGDSRGLSQEFFILDFGVGVLASSPQDAVKTSGANFTSTPSTGASATLGQAREIVIGFVGEGSGGAANLFTQAQGWTELIDRFDSGTPGRGIGLAYREVNETTAVTYAPTAGNSFTGRIGLVTLKSADNTTPTATKFYLPSTGAADVSPAFSLSGVWEGTTGADRIKPVTTKISSTMTSKTCTEDTSTTNNRDYLNRQYVSDPLVAQDLVGTIKGQIRSQESSASANYLSQCVVYVVSNDGSTLRATLYGGDVRTTNSDEWTTTLRNQQVPAPTGSPVPITPYTCVDGDRLVFEFGVRAQNTAATQFTSTQSFGDDNASDLSLAGTETTALNPWLQFSAQLSFQSSSTPISSTDTGAGTEAFGSLGILPTGDTGTDSETFSMIGALTVTDAATGAESVTLAGIQFVNPSADSVDGNWLNELGTNTNMFASIADGVAPNDTNYIISENSPVNSATRVKLATITDPGDDTRHVIQWRVGKDVTGGQVVGVTVSLYQGGGNVLGAGTLVASFTRSAVDALATFSEALSTGQAATITDYSNLYLEFSANAV